MFPKSVFLAIQILRNFNEGMYIVISIICVRILALVYFLNFGNLNKSFTYVG